MHRLRRYISFVNIQAGEERLIGQLVLLASLMELTYALIQAMAFGVFVSEHGPQSLPYSYILISMFAPLAALLYIKAGGWVPFAGVLKYTLVSLAIFCVLTWIGLRSNFFHAVSFILPLLYQVVANLGSLIVWPLSGRVLTLGQVKRLFPLIVAGGWLSNILGGLLILPLVGWMGAPDLLLLASVTLGLALLVLTQITRMPAAQETSRQEARPQQSAKGMFRNPYILLIFAYIILWWGTFFFLDNIFADGVASWFSDVSALTAFRGQVSAATGILALIFSMFLAGRLIARFGLQTGLLLEVVTLMVLVGLLVVNGSLNGSATVAFFLTTFAKVANVALGYSVSLVAYEILYQPLVAMVRSNVQATADGIFQPIASGMAGVSILVLMTVWKFDYLDLAYIYLVLGAALVLVILFLSKRYVYALSEAITKRRLGESTRLIADAASVELLKRRLRDPHPGLVMYAFQKLEQLAPEYVAEAIPDLLQHPTPDVRREAYAYIERTRLRSAQGDISRHLTSESVPIVKGAGLRALGAIVDGDNASPLLNALHQTDPHELRGALVGLLKYQNHARSEQMLAGLSTSQNMEDRIVASHVLGEIDQPKFASLHETLISDPDLQVRLAAIEAAGTSKQPSLYPLLLESSAAPETSHVAGQALVAIGRDALPDVERALSTPDAPRQLVLTLSRVIARIDPVRARSILYSRMDSTDSEVRSRILVTLAECGYRARETGQIFRTVQDEARQVVWMYAIHVELENHPSAVLLCAALKQLIEQSIDRVLLLASFVFDAESLLKAREALLAGSSSQRAYALEIIDSQLPMEWKATILPLLEDDPSQEKLARLVLIYPQASVALDEQLRAMIAGSKQGQLTDWVRACAIYTAVKLDARTCFETIQSVSLESNKLVCETACWAIDQFTNNARERKNTMLSTIEKVLVLRMVEMFGQTPDNVLADVAGLLEEVEVLEGESIFQEGDPGDSMYIIVDGKVRVHTADRLLNYLGESDVFGEMALLDPAPRVATVTAVEPTRLFRLDQSPFYQLMSERPEIATGILRVLTRHLRKRVQDLSQLERRVKDLEFSSAARSV